MKKLLALCLVFMLLLCLMCSCKSPEPPVSAEQSLPETSIAQQNPEPEQAYSITGGLYYKGKLYLRDDILKKMDRPSSSALIAFLPVFWIIDDFLYFETFESIDTETQQPCDAVLYRADLELNDITEIYKTKGELSNWFASDADPSSTFTFDKHTNLFYFLSWTSETSADLMSVDQSGKSERNYITIDTYNSGYYDGTGIHNINETDIIFQIDLRNSTSDSKILIQRYNKTTGKTSKQHSDEWLVRAHEKVSKDGEEYYFSDFDLCAKDAITSKEKIVANFSEYHLYEEEIGALRFANVCGIIGEKILIDIPNISQAGPARNSYALLTYNPATGEKETIYQNEK